MIYLLAAAALLLAGGTSHAKPGTIRDYPTWMRYAECRNVGHGERYCRREIAR